MAEAGPCTDRLERQSALHTHRSNSHASDFGWIEPRAKITAKRGGENLRIELQDLASPMPDSELLSLDEAMTRLATIKPDHAKLIELRYFAGMNNDEAAAAINVSPATGRRMMNYAKAWIKVDLAK